MEEPRILYSYTVPRKEMTINGKVYLGVFLAFSLFFSFIFGNILFFTIVVMLTFLIFLSKERYEDLEVFFFEGGIVSGNSAYYFEDLLSYSFVEKVFEIEKLFLKLTFKSALQQDVYIDIVDYEDLYNVGEILSNRVKEEKKSEISLVDEIILAFFH